MLTVALSQPGCDEVFVGFEHELLTEGLDDRLAELEPGVLATWNGAAFDLPFLADRKSLAQQGSSSGSSSGSTRASGCSTPLPGAPVRTGAAWHQHCHVDAYHLPGRRFGPQHRGPARLRQQRDARLARVLTERRWASASRFVDRLGARHPRS